MSAIQTRQDPPDEARRALILDSDPGVGATVRMIAERAGYAATVHHDPTTFMRAVADERPSHIVLDLVLAGTDGVEVLRRLAAAGCDASIIITSAVGTRVLDAAQRLTVEQGLNLRGVLAKPFPVAALWALLEAAPPANRAAGCAAPAPCAEFDRAGLSAAIERGELTVVFQPKISCTRRQPVGFEALAKWYRPDGTLVPTHGFVTMAEQAGLIGHLTEHVVDSALRWFGSVPQHLTLAINLSPLSLDDMDTVSHLVDRCAAHGIAPERVVLEMTETAAMRDPIATLGVLTRLRVRGFRVSIDDFGIGYSSIAQLARLPFSELKIDGSFVKSMTASSENRSIVSAMVGLGHSLGLVVAGEGVEDAETLELLSDLGCDHAQGFFIAPPLPAQQATAWALAPDGAPQPRRKM